MSFRFCFTENNPEGDIIYWELYPEVQYAIYQLELGEQHTMHLQGYVELKSKQHLSFLKKMLPRAHWEKAKGTLADNIKYCSKSKGKLNGPFEYGTPRAGQGKRSDINEYKEALLRGDSEQTIANNCFAAWARYPALYQRWKSIHCKPRDGSVDITCILCIGPPGVGKSRWANTNYPNAYRRPAGERWWPHYYGQTEVIMDDFSGAFLRLHDFLRIVDRYQLTLEVKNGHVEISAHTFIITTNIEPESWWNDQFYTQTLKAAVTRRITKVLKFEENSFREFSSYDEYKWAQFFVPSFITAD